MFSWDQVYETELENFQDHGDEGEIWFGKGVERKVIDWMKINCSPSIDPRILDLGCGNGHFTLKLMESGWSKVSALDYSEKAVEFAKKLINSDNDDRIFQADILSSATIPEKYLNSFDIIVDKGTFDAISLNPNFSGKLKTEIIAESFKKTLKNLFSIFCPKVFHLFIITSCNWTSQELVTIFAPEFRPIDEVIHTKFVFGGKSGQDVSTVIFKLEK